MRLPKDVRNWFDDLSVTRAGSAHRALAVLSSMMKRAEALGLRREDSNPCKGLRRRKTGFEAHYLTDDEFAALGRARSTARKRIIRSLSPWCASCSTPARASPKRCGSSGSTFTTTARCCQILRPVPRTIWLASPARAVLAARQLCTNCPWVFPSPCGGPATADKEWNAIRAAAGLPALRIHDLRHSHAAVAANGGEGLRIVAGLLGHADIATTSGYAHLAEGSVFDAPHRVSRGLADMLDGGEADR